MSAGLAMLMVGTYALGALAASTMLAVHVCMTSPWGGVGIRSHALGALTFVVSLISAALVAGLLATVGVLLLGAAM